MTADEHVWYARPVFFVRDLARAIAFYHRLGFEKAWHEADGAGTVCQMQRGGCEVILCQDARRVDRARLFIELRADALAALRADLERNAVPNGLGWWGYDVVTVEDPDGNELLFPME